MRAARKAVAPSAKVVCDAIGVRPNTWSQWENGRGYPDPSFMIAFCVRFHVSMDWIYLGDPRGLPLRIAKKIDEAFPESISRALEQSGYALPHNRK